MERSGLGSILRLVPLLVLAGLGSTALADPEAPPIRIESAADRTVVRIGDAITYRVTVTYDSTLAVASGLPRGSLDAFEVRDHGTEEVPAEGGSRSLTEHFVLASYVFGRQEIGQRPYLIRFPDGCIDTLRTAPIAVDVVATLPEDAEDIRDIKGPAEIARVDALGWVIGIGVGLAAAAAFVLWWLRRGRPGVIRMPPPRPAHELAYGAFEELERLNLAAAGRMKAYYIALSETLRRYLGARFGVPAMDRTTAELLQLLRRAECGRDVLAAIEEVLDLSDRAKFARWGGNLENASRGMERSLWVVERTRRPETEDRAPAAVVGGGRGA